jgi:hypothetical protein
MSVINLNTRYLTIFILLWMSLAARHCLANEDVDGSEIETETDFSVSQTRNDFSISEIHHSSREEPLKLEVKSSDLILPNVLTPGSTGSTGSTGLTESTGFTGSNESTDSTTLARSTTTPWSTSDMTTLIRRHSTVEPILKVQDCFGFAFNIF